MSMPAKDGKAVPFAYCDIYKFRDGLISELLTFMAETQGQPQTEPLPPPR